MIPTGILTSYATSTPIPTTGSIVFSLRKIVSGYLGNVVRVRRSSDNTELDIPFSGTYIDQTALTNFVGSGSGFVTIWYDQGQYSKNWIQTTQANQPRIINAGTLEQVNGKIAIYFDGSNDSLTASFTSITNTASKMSIFQVFKINATSQFVVNTFNGSSYNLAGSNGAGGGTDQFSVTPKYKNGSLITNTTQGQTWTNFNTNSQVLCSQFSSSITQTSAIGFSDFSAWPLKGWLQEEIYYLYDESANLTTINNNINSFYTIY